MTNSADSDQLAYTGHVVFSKRGVDDAYVIFFSDSLFELPLLIHKSISPEASSNEYQPHMLLERTR